jgi:hypothetical protein
MPEALFPFYIHPKTIPNGSITTVVVSVSAPTSKAGAPKNASAHVATGYLSEK